MDLPGVSKHGSHSGFSFFHSIPDSADDTDHVVVQGEEGEQPPVFEKEITGKKGEKIFIYKRTKPVEKKQQTIPREDNLNLFPNPNNGKFSLRFHTNDKDGFSLKIIDAQGKEVYSKKVSDADGDYYDEIDISSRGKGNYILKITQIDQTFIEKFIVE